MNRATQLVTLGLLALVGISATYVVQRINAPQISAQQRLLDSRKLLDVLPAEAYDNQPLAQPLALGELVVPANVPLFAAGDLRVNAHPGLIAVTTILAREHNRFAAAAKAQDPTRTDEQCVVFIYFSTLA